ncbi:MAG TPA: hypothetical protein VEY89_10385, partial [Candidatus Dormibacteraeota bacterium]|nr:hypothetical protein [Candidatus Dormibacteraeota bacterium]
IGLPLITHNRWIDPQSPDRDRYHISGFAALDPAWWHDVMTYLAASGVATYEQDWLSVIYEHSPELAATAGAGDAFSDGMAHAAQEQGLTLQYCMPLPRHFLEGARYPNLTSIRVSGDRFARDRWDSFLYTSRLASALGICPWSDLSMSAEADNLLVATLSTGLVGIGDRIGAERRTSLLRAVRADGVIVKPDSALVPLDAMYRAAASAPMIAAARGDHSGVQSRYVFAYSRSARPAHAEFTPAQLGLTRDAYVYDYRSRIALRVQATDPFGFELPAGGSAYFVVVPVGRGGLALFGDAARFVPNGAKRVAALAADGPRLSATVTFAPQEQSVRLFGYAPRRPTITAATGSVGEVSFDARSGRFEADVAPGPEREVESPGNDPVRRATLTVNAE